MTFVGKILVIVILAFSLFFLGLSVVVFTASTNWKEAYATKNAEVTKLAGDIAAAKQAVEAANTSLDAEKQRALGEIDAQKKIAADLEVQINDLQTQASALKTQLETAQRSTEVSGKEAQDLAAETAVIREALQAAQRQANDFKAQQTQLRENITVLERQLAAAEQNNKDLRNNLAITNNFLSSRGLPTDVDQIKLATGDAIASPDIEGQVLEVDPRNERIVVSIGSDDGVVVGQEYFIYRTTETTSEFVGKVRIAGTEPDRAVGRVVSRYLGRKVVEGDNVAGQIQPRS